MNCLEPLRQLKSLASLDIESAARFSLSALLDLGSLVELTISHSMMNDPAFAELKEVIEHRGGSIRIVRD